MRRIWVEVAAIGFLILAETSFGQSIDAENEHARKCSVFQAAFDRADSIRSGSVLVTQTILHDTVDATGEKSNGVFRESKFVSRFVFEIDQERFCQLEKKDTEWIDFATQEEKPLGGGLLSPPSAWCMDWKSKTLFRSTSKEKLGTRAFGKMALNDVLTNLNYLDPRLLGLAPLQSGVAIEEAKQYFAKRASGEHLLDCTQKGDNLVIRLELVINNSPQLRETFEFDAANSLIRKFSFEALLESKWYPQDSCEVTWAKSGEFLVPVKVFCKRYRSLKSTDGKKYYGDEQITTELEWLSINEPIAPEFFDGTIVGSTESILEQLKPRKSKTEVENKTPNR